MESERFDGLAKAAATGRRSLLKALGARSGAGLLVLLGARYDGLAGSRRPACNGGCERSKKCYRGQCRYPAKRIGSACEPQGPPCRNGSICSATGGKKRGKCICPAALARCGVGSQAFCRDLGTDAANCGACGTQCVSGVTTCQEGHCCTVDGAACPSGCGPGNSCLGCCSRVCQLDGTCAAATACLENGVACPGGCGPRTACLGCCDGTCNSSGECAGWLCALYGQPCVESTDCCNGVPCLFTSGVNGLRCRYT
jgi:hypothetical protein